MFSPENISNGYKYIWKVSSCRAVGIKQGLHECQATLPLVKILTLNASSDSERGKQM